ncbi:MAG: hypothetical protein K2H68_06615, partial [Bacteroidales bacterium]|nr:hypothetical protein [Bacteroidales bacterium]
AGHRRYASVRGAGGKDAHAQDTQDKYTANHKKTILSHTFQIFTPKGNPMAKVRIFFVSLIFKNQPS